MPGSGGSRKGRHNNPRERMLRFIEDQWPDFDPVARMIEQAEITRAEMIEQDRLHKAEQKVCDAGGISQEDVTPAVPRADRNMLTSMYERPARYLAPRLKEQEIKIGGLDGGPVTVRFARDDSEIPEA